LHSVFPTQSTARRSRAAVVLKEPLSEAELKRFLMERLASFKVPKVIRFVDMLPRSGSGKVSRKAAAQAFKNP